MVVGILLLLAVDDVTRILTYFFIISFFMMIAIYTGRMSLDEVVDIKLDLISKRNLYRAIVLCSILSIFIPNYYIDNGKLHVPNTTLSYFPKPEEREAIIAYSSPRAVKVHRKFGGASIRFNGKGDRLEIVDHIDWAFDTRDFTIDFWLRFEYISGTQVLVGYPYYSPNKAWQITWEEELNSLKFSYSIDGSGNTDARFLWSPSTDTWYHIAIVRNGSDLTAFVDGSLIGSKHHIGGLPIYDSKDPLYIGSRGTEEHFNGWLDEIRISKGVARWTSNFVLPSSEYKADSYTKLLLHCNDTAQKKLIPGLDDNRSNNSQKGY